MNNMEDFMLFTTINQPKGAVKKHIYCFIHMWVCGCKCVYACVWVGWIVHSDVLGVCMWKPETKVELFLKCLRFLTRSLIGLDLSDTLIEYLASNPERSSWRTSLSAGIRKCAVLPFPTFSGYCGLNSGPLSCLANIFLTESSLQPLAIVLTLYI